LIRRQVLDSEPTYIRCEYCGNIGTLEHGMLQRRWAWTQRQLEACLKALRRGDTLVVWKLDRLGRSLSHLLRIIEGLKEEGVTFKSLTESMIDTTTPQGEMLFGFFGLMAQYERALIRERVMAGLDAARKRGRHGGASFRMTAPKLRLAQASMRNPGTTVGDLARELGVSRQTIYRHLALRCIEPAGQIISRAGGPRRPRTRTRRNSRLPRQPSSPRPSGILGIGRGLIA
jgi:Resolvase, N terminal domain/HTH domain